MSSTLIPTPEKVGPPLLSDRPISQISDQQLENAARVAGLITLRPKTIKAFRAIGQRLNDEGIALIQAGRIVHVSEKLRELGKAAEAVMNSNDDPEVKLDAIRAAVTAYKESVEADQTVVKMLEQKMLGEPSDRRKHRAFSAGAVVAINTSGPVNVESSET